jgi:hypothetical protein
MSQATGHHGKIQPHGGVIESVCQEQPSPGGTSPQIPGRTTANFHTPPLRHSINLASRSCFYVMANAASLPVWQRYPPRKHTNKNLENIKQHNRPTSQATTFARNVGIKFGRFLPLSSSGGPNHRDPLPTSSNSPRHGPRNSGDWGGLARGSPIFCFSK